MVISWKPNRTHTSVSLHVSYIPFEGTHILLKNGTQHDHEDASKKEHYNKPEDTTRSHQKASALENNTSRV